MRTAYYVAMSLDGRIAGPEHDLSFLQTLAGGPEGYGYDEFIAGIDGLVVGASSWDFMKDYPWTYGDRPVWVLNGPTLTGRGYEIAEGPLPGRAITQAAGARPHIATVASGRDR